MNKKIEFDYEDKHYVLEYSRSTVGIMEDNGFDINQFTKKPASMLPKAFQGAFLKNNPRVTLKEIENIFDNIKNKEKLMGTLAEMLTETYDTILANNEEDNGKNIDWKIV